MAKDMPVLRQEFLLQGLQATQHTNTGPLRQSTHRHTPQTPCLCVLRGRRLEACTLDRGRVYFFDMSSTSGYIGAKYVQ